MTTPSRILLAFPGGEVTLFAYKRPPTPEAVFRKAAELASGLFPGWYWADDREVPAIACYDSPAMLLMVSGPAGREVGL